MQVDKILFRYYPDARDPYVDIYIKKDCRVEKIDTLEIGDFDLSTPERYDYLQSIVERIAFFDGYYVL